MTDKNNNIDIQIPLSITVNINNTKNDNNMLKLIYNKLDSNISGQLGEPTSLLKLSAW